MRIIFNTPAGLAPIALCGTLTVRLRWNRYIGFALGGVLAALTFWQSRIYAGPEAFVARYRVEKSIVLDRARKSRGAGIIIGPASRIVAALRRGR